MVRRAGGWGFWDRDGNNQVGVGTCVCALTVVGVPG